LYWDGRVLSLIRMLVDLNFVRGRRIRGDVDQLERAGMNSWTLVGRIISSGRAFLWYNRAIL